LKNFRHYKVFDKKKISGCMTYVVHPVKVISVWSTVKDISGSLFTNLTLYQLYKK
jgi:hypothetical protein